MAVARLARQTRQRRQKRQRGQSGPRPHQTPQPPQLIAIAPSCPPGRTWFDSYGNRLPEPERT